MTIKTRKNNWKYISLSLFLLYLVLANIELLVWLNVDFAGQINYDFISDRQSLRIVKPLLDSGAVISYHRDETGIKYRVPLIAEPAIFPFYREYSSQEIPGILKKLDN